MASADKQPYDEQLLIRYLLGEVPDEEAERLDESSITDTEFVLRLDAVENDLVDAYVKGELSADTLERFEKFYLSSPKKREKVDFARTFLRFAEKSARAAAKAAAAPAIAGAAQREKAPKERSARRWFTVPRLNLQWGVAAAALVMLLASSYLFVENEHLRHQGTEAREREAALDHRAQELERELSDQRSANTGIRKELDRLRESLPPSGSLKTIAVLLLPQTRGVGQITTVAVPRGTDRVTLRLQLETDEFPWYQVALKDPITNRVLWRGGYLLRAKPEGNSKAVSVSLSAKLFKPQNYIMEVSGVSRSGAPELISGYPVKIVLE